MADNSGDEMNKFKSDLPMIPMRDIVVYPFMIIPLFIGREKSIAAVEDSLKNSDRMIFLSTQKNLKDESPEIEDIYSVGTVAMIMRVKRLGDGRLKVLIQGVSKAKIVGDKSTENFYKVKLSEVKEPEVQLKPEAIRLMNQTKDLLKELVSYGDFISEDLITVVEDVDNPSRVADLISSNLNLKVETSQKILETINPLERLEKICNIIEDEIKLLSIHEQFTNNESQNIGQNPPGGMAPPFGKPSTNEEISEYRKKLALSTLPSHARKVALKQIQRLENMHPESSESNIIRTYLDLMLELPWGTSTKENLDLKETQGLLDENHFEMTKVKQRILEFLAVKKLKGEDAKSPVICLYGPPGVGKTSLAKSIAKSMGRKFSRISLGGVKDEAEIRGHRKTYVGAMPGRLIQAFKTVGVNNPVILLDEVDKISADHRGDPANALLEVLDPEQNKDFRDHYLAVEFDLSKVMFICTANEIGSIPPPLRDRMEIIELTGYSIEEKQTIAQKYIIPKQEEETGLEKDSFKISDKTLAHVIRQYTRESGVRGLEKEVAKIARKIAIDKVMGEKLLLPITPNNLHKYLGVPKVSDDSSFRHSEPGVATGLAWTSVGGEVLPIEGSISPGSGLVLTGNLGDVMKESARAAIGFIKSELKTLGLSKKVFEENEIHLHFPAAAIPKDGPSAGITITTVIISLLTNRNVGEKIAMTGEISLKGHILPVGGIKEKLLAALRNGYTTVIIPHQNKKDLEEVPKEFLKKVKVVYAEHYLDVLELIFKTSPNEGRLVA